MRKIKKLEQLERDFIMKIKLFNMQELQFGLSGIAGNLLVNLPYGKHAYYGREAATRNVSAVTGACLFSRREVYKEVRIYG